MIEADKDIAGKHGLKNAIVFSIAKNNNGITLSEIQAVVPFMSKSAIGRSMRYLRDVGLLNKKIMSPEDVKEIVLTKKKMFVCEWCNCKTLVLEEHHYPISKSDGGEKTVNICPNCHRAYHSIIGKQ